MMFRAFEEDHSVRAPTTQTVRQQPAPEATRVTQLKPLTRKFPRGPADWRRQGTFPSEKRRKDTKNGQEARPREFKKVPDPNAMKLSNPRVKEYAFLTPKTRFTQGCCALSSCHSYRTPLIPGNNNKIVTRW
jgi:hypothetical protein